MSDHPLNILYLTHNSDRGESAMIIGMHRAGMDVRVFANLESRYVQAIQAAGIAVTHVCWKQKLDRAALKLIWRTIVEDLLDADLRTSVDDSDAQQARAPALLRVP